MLIRLFFFPLLLAGCSASLPVIEPAELDRMLHTGQAPLVIDVRSEAEYLKGHIPGAVHIQFWNVDEAPPKVLQACRKKPVVVTCEHGPRARFAAPKLRDLGCPDVRLLDGHMARWRAQGYLMTAPGMGD